MYPRKVWYNLWFKQRLISAGDSAMRLAQSVPVRQRGACPIVHKYFFEEHASGNITTMFMVMNLVRRLRELSLAQIVVRKGPAATAQAS